MTPTEASKVRLSDLQQGDVLLHNGKSWISKTILLLDGGDYSHASIFVGPMDFRDRAGRPDRHGVPTLIQATLPKVEYEPVDERRKEDNFIDAYRWHSPAPEETMGSQRYPAGPVLEQAGTYLGDDYAKHELALVALLIVLKMSGKLSLTQRWLVALVGLFLNDTLSDGRRTLVCSELVARSFDEARYGESTGHYHLRVQAPWYLLKNMPQLKRMAAAAGTEKLRSAGTSPSPPPDPSQAEVDEHLDEVMRELGLPGPQSEVPAGRSPAMSFAAPLSTLKSQASLAPQPSSGTGASAADALRSHEVTLSSLGMGSDADDESFRRSFLKLYLQTDDVRPEGIALEPPPPLVSPQLIAESESLTRLGRLEIAGFSDTDNSAFNLRVSGGLLGVLGAALVVVALLGRAGVMAEGSGSFGWGALSLAAGAGLWLWARRRA